MSSSESEKKLKQLRLPFAPINKDKKTPSGAAPPTGNESQDDSFSSSNACNGKKRKHSTSEKETLLPNKVLKQENKDNDVTGNASKANEATSVSAEKQPSSENESKKPETESPKLDKENDGTGSEAKKCRVVVSALTADEENLISDSVANDKTEKMTSLKVEIAKCSVKLHELKDELDEKVEKQDFIAAQKLKTQMDQVEKDKKEMEIIMENADPIEIDSLLRRLKNSSNTPKRKRTSNVNVVKTPGANQTVPKTVPKNTGSAQKKLEREKKKEEEKLEREKEKLEKERKKELEKAEREKKKELEKAEREKKKEEEKNEKERKRKEKEEQREIEKREKEELLKKKREDKEKEKREKEELKEKEKKKIEQKHEKMKASFSSFFLKKEESKDDQNQKNESDDKPEDNPNNFNQFRIKSNMKLAPLSRRPLSDKQKESLTEFLLSQQNKENYLKIIKLKNYNKGKSGKTWILEKIEEENEVEILDEDDEASGDFAKDVEDDDDLITKIKTKVKAKLFKFHENQRPPYWGTWTKKSRNVTARRPFGTDPLFDYDYDSDDDWEEEEQGESLSDEEKDKEDDVDEGEEDEDDGFFVGHGVLDKDEMMETVDDDDDEIHYDENLEAVKQKLKAKQFEEEYKKKKPTKLKPKVFGCLWIGINENEDEELQMNEIAIMQLTKILDPYKCVQLTGNKDSIKLIPDEPSPVATPNTESKNFRRDFPEEAVPFLIRLIHKNSHNKVFLSQEFMAFWERRENNGKTTTTPSTIKCSFSKRKCLDKIAELAQFERKNWMVKSEILEKYYPNTELDEWTYTLDVPVRKNETPKVEESPIPAAQTPKSNLITNFTKVMTQEERDKQMTSSSPSGTPKRVASNITPKRVANQTLTDKKRVTLTTLSTPNDKNKPSPSVGSEKKRVTLTTLSSPKVTPKEKKRVTLTTLLNGTPKTPKNGAAPIPRGNSTKKLKLSTDEPEVINLE